MAALLSNSHSVSAKTPGGLRGSQVTRTGKFRSARASPALVGARGGTFFYERSLNTIENKVPDIHKSGSKPLDY